MQTSKPRPRNYALELDFRRAVQQVPRRERPTLRAWLRRYRRQGRRCARTFYELDPVTGEWRTL